MENYIWETPTEIDKELALRVKRIRKRKKITQKELAMRANVSYGTLKKFEQTGDISLKALTKIALELGVIDEIKGLFNRTVYSSLEEVVNEKQQNS